MKNISVCQIVGYYNYGGISHFVTNLSKELKKNNCDIKYLCRNCYGENKDNIDIIETKPKNTFDHWKKLKKFINNNEFDIIHTHDVYTLPILVNLKQDCKIVYTEHGIIPVRYNNIKSITGTNFARICAIYGIPRIDATVTISDYLYNKLSNRYSNIIKIYNGICFDYFINDVNNCQPSVNASKPILLYVGLLEKPKGINFLINSMNTIKEHFPECQLYVVGNGSLYGKLLKYITIHNMNKQIHFVGYTKEVLYYYKKCDILIVPSYIETFSLPIIEAMTCGKPVIARDAYAMKDHIKNSNAGVTFTKDNPNDLVNSIRLIINNYEEYSINAIKYSDRFNIKSSTEKYLKLYKDIINV